MITIVDYSAGNTQSVINALNRIGVECMVSNNAEVILKAEKVILPGVGEASSAMSSLRNLNLEMLIPQLKQPVLGICLGMQLMCLHSEENDTDCLGIFDHKVLKFKTQNIVPHIGWNELTKVQNPLFDEKMNGSDVYFVHSYYVPIVSETCATADYEGQFSAAIQKDNFHGVQFHPEKSGTLGSIILENFINL